MRVLVLVLVACASAPRGPTAVVRLAGEWTSEDREWVLRGAGAWQPLGFNVALDRATLPECPYRWHTHADTDCTVTMGMSRELGMVTAGSADRERRSIRVNAGLRGWDLMSTVAHEVGHVLLNVGHLPPGQRGIMQADGSRDIIVTGADRALACETVKRGCK